MLKSSRRLVSQRIRLPDAREVHLEIGGNQEAQKTLVFLPGALGSLETDFKPQFAPESPLAQNYRLICFEPAGYGRSRPPQRTWPKLGIEIVPLSGHECMCLC